MQVLVDIAGKLSPKNRRLAIKRGTFALRARLKSKLVKVLKEQEDEGKG